MSKWYGKVGYGIMSEVRPGVWEDAIIERSYYGDMTRVASSSEQSESVNNNIQLKHNISIVADAYALQNYTLIKYITIMGVRWVVRSIEVQRPRLELSIGGVYNGPTPEVTDAPGADSEN